MQLKMANSFNAKHIKELIQTEDRFLTELFGKMPLPTTEPGDENDDSGEETQSTKKVNIFPASGKAKRAQTFEELHQKLDQLKGKKKLEHKQKLLKKGLKNRIKKKSKRDERLAQKKMARAEQNSAGGVTRVKSEEGVEVAPKISKAKPVFNSEGNMVFSKFDFSEIGTKKKPPKTETDPKKALQLLQQKKEKIKGLELAGETEKAQEIKEKDAWRSALAKAGGEKVKDDPELLKRTIKRTEQQKSRSSKKWDSRIEGVQKKKQEAQQKRQENILKRKKDKKTNKLKKASKKGRVIPGF
ncbi:surfeit locus protein 6 homolog [Venturia canescens]|uniref:surfeit locus protein 6 homolog n=1 Tax=Venturia canescens TaxID=32260 RepID=UPI001C9D137F|nr:surfeit locus protein 6 homolog [Venturia canescens]